MTILSEHLVLSDPPIAASPLSSTDPGPVTLPVTLPDGFIDTAGSQPLLSFRLDTAGTPVDLTFEVQSSNTGIPPFLVEFTGIYNSDVSHSVQEVINAGSLTVAGTNSITFEYVSGTGTAEISDVVLLVKRSAVETNTGTGSGVGGD